MVLVTLGVIGLKSCEIDLRLSSVIATQTMSYFYNHLINFTRLQMTSHICCSRTVVFCLMLLCRFISLNNVLLIKADEFISELKIAALSYDYHCGANIWSKHSF